MDGEWRFSGEVGNFNKEIGKFFLYIVRSTYVKIEKSPKERPLGSTEGEDYIQSILLLLFRFLFMREFRKYIYLYIQIT